MLLLLAKLFVACWITLTSAVGVWLPIFYVRRSHEESSPGSGNGDGAFARLKRASVGASTTTRLYLSLANCLSAGMLLTMALTHFLPEAFEAESAGVAPAPTPLCFWMLVGILVPVMLERSMKGGEGHSHSMVSEADDSHAHGSAGVNGGGGAVSAATLLIVLMCFHGMTEGLLLGFENKTAALLSAAIPLSIHRFCDGLVIGVATVKELHAQGEEEIPIVLPGLEAEGASSCSPLRFWRRLYRGRVGVWLLLTPITMVCVVLFAPTASTAAVAAVENANLRTPLSQAPLEMLSVEARSTATSSVSTLAAVQAIGSGSFVYIGLSILHSEDLKGMSANAALLTGVALTGGLFLLSSSSH